MRPRPRRSSNAARSSSASGGCAIALSPTASRKLATACSPSHGCRQVSGEAREQRTRSSVCTKSSSGGSRRRPCCHRLIPQRCCSGRCSPLVRSTCARLMVGRRLPPSPSISRLTSRPDRVLSKCRRSRHPIPTPLATAPIDPFGTILLPALLLLMRSPFLFGYAKPVPVNFRALRKPRRDMIWVAAAGPAMNFALATAAALSFHLIVYVPVATEQWVAGNLKNALIINVLLAMFNLLPLPPLDGGRIAVGVLPDGLALPLARLRPSRLDRRK